METIRKDIKNKAFRPVYLIYGEEAYMVDYIQHMLCDAISGGDSFNKSSFSGEKLDINQIRDLSATVPFLADRRLIVIKDSGWFMHPVDGLENVIAQIPDTTTIVFAERGADRRTKAFKAAAGAGYVSEQKRRSEGELTVWAAGMLKKRGRQISRADAEFFIETVGDDMGLAAEELKKLAAYTEGSDTVRRKDIEAVCTRQINSQVFRMTEELAMGRRENAMRLYADLAALKEEPVKILALISRHFLQLSQTRELLKTGANKNTVSQKLKVPPFAAEKLIRQAGKMSSEELRARLAECAEYDEAIKTGRMGKELALEMLICGRKMKNQI